MMAKQTGVDDENRPPSPFYKGGVEHTSLRQSPPVVGRGGGEGFEIKFLSK